MIRTTVKVSGTISKEAQVRTDKNQKQYLSFSLTVALSDAKTGETPVNIYVSYYNGSGDDMQKLVTGKHVTLEGSMDVRKKDTYSFFLTAEKYELHEEKPINKITGQLVFRGRLKNDNIFEEKKDKKGNPFLIFSAFSAEKIEDKFYSTWVNFMRFPEKGAGIETIKPEFMKPKAQVEILGDLNITSYGGNLRFSSLVKEISEYHRPEHQ